MPRNPKYEHVQGVVDTGMNVRKVQNISTCTAHRPPTRGRPCALRNTPSTLLAALLPVGNCLRRRPSLASCTPACRACPVLRMVVAHELLVLHTVLCTAWLAVSHLYAAAPALLAYTLPQPRAST